MVCASLQTFGVRCFYALRLTHGPRGRAGNEPRKGGRGLRSPLQVVCSIDDDVHAWPGAAEVGYSYSVEHALDANNGTDHAHNGTDDANDGTQ